MRLEKLVLSGFKSFADKTTFEFKKNFTAIVGPNGSGKSNVADAIRWVLGEQSLKTLRGKQSTDLIFSGSEKLGKLGMAVVELHLSNDDRAFPLEYPEVVITRKLFRDGESEYRINGSTVRLQDIVMLLAQAKFGQKSYAVIGQGMITHFLSAGPQERKVFFDEATGVREYQIKRDQAINKLIRTEEHLTQSQALLTEIEPHLASLTRQVKRLEKREKLEAELRDVEVQYFGSLWHELQTEKTDLSHQLQQRQAAIDTLEAELAQKQTASDAISNEASRAERYQALQKKFNRVLEEKSHALKEQAVLKGRLEVERERQGQLSLVWMQRKEDEITRDIHALESEHRELQETSSGHKSALARAESELQSSQDEFRELEYDILKLKEQIEKDTHAMSIPEVQTQLQGLFEYQEDFLRELLATTSMDEFRQVQAKAKFVTKAFAELMDKLGSGEKETVEALRVDMKQKEQSLERLMKEREAAQNRMNDLRVRIAEADARAHVVHTQLKRLQDELADIQGSIDEETNNADEEKKNRQAEAYQTELIQFDRVIEKLNKQLDAIREDIDSFNQQEEEKKARLVNIQSDMRQLQRKLTTARQELSTLEINSARVETRLEDTLQSVQRQVPETFHTSIFKYRSTVQNPRTGLEHRMEQLERQLASIGTIDKETVTEYEETKQRFDFLQEQTTDLVTSINSLERVIDELDKTIHSQFQKNFKIINEGFQKYFKVLFDGGTAKLELLTEVPEEETADGSAESAGPEAAAAGGADHVETMEEEKMRELIGKKKKKQRIISGIDVIASPPGKKVTNVNSLSGGEKSLASIALICSIIAHNPSPFVFLDEVEAALDEENSEKLAAILTQLATKTQIIVITHNRVTMKSSDILYGVTIGTEGKSHILSVELKEAEELVEA